MQKLPAKPLDSQINVADSSDVRYWCRKLGCAQSDLLAAVKVLGPVALDVAKYVRRRLQWRGSRGLCSVLTLPAGLTQQRKWRVLK